MWYIQYNAHSILLFDLKPFVTKFILKVHYLTFSIFSQMFTNVNNIWFQSSSKTHVNTQTTIIYYYIDL